MRSETTMDDKLLLTIQEAAHRIGLGRTFTYDLIRRGDLRSLKIGAARRIAVADIEEFINRLREVDEDQ